MYRTQITRIALVGFLMVMSACSAKKTAEESYEMPMVYDSNDEMDRSDAPVGRSYQSAVSTAAGVTGGGGNKSLGGGSTNENTYMLDGANITDPSSGAFAQGGRGKKARPPSAPPAPPRSEPVESPAPEAEPEQTAQQAPARMVHYDGHARIRVTKTSDLLEKIEEVAIESGGRVDRLYGNTITIRVPVGEFDATWKTLLDLGDVLSRSVRADDISAQFLAVDLRVKTLRTTLNRLIELLAKAIEEEEKLALLQQITRVTEQLDQFESQLRTLSDLAAMSRITIEAIPREQYAGQRRGEYDGFLWLSQISPFRRAVFEDDHRIGLPDTEGLVTLSNKGPFVAESPDGTVFWTQRMENDPQGDGAFWVAALADRLEGQFTRYHRSEIGSWSCLGLDEAGADAPYHWQICVQPDGKHLNVSQVFFPDPDQWTRYGPRIAGVMRLGGAS